MGFVHGFVSTHWFAEMYSDNRGFFQSLGNDEVNRIVVGYKDVEFVISIVRWCTSLLKK